MALHPDFPESPHAVLDPSVRWFAADEVLRETTSDKLMPPLVSQLRRKVKEFRDGGGGRRELGTPVSMPRTMKPTRLSEVAISP